MEMMSSICRALAARRIFAKTGVVSAARSALMIFRTSHSRNAASRSNVRVRGMCGRNAGTAAFTATATS